MSDGWPQPLMVDWAFLDKWQQRPPFIAVRRRILLRLSGRCIIKVARSIIDGQIRDLWPERTDVGCSVFNKALSQINGACPWQFRKSKNNACAAVLNSRSRGLFALLDQLPRNMTVSRLMVMQLMWLTLYVFWFLKST